MERPLSTRQPHSMQQCGICLRDTCLMPEASHTGCIAQSGISRASTIQPCGSCHALPRPTFLVVLQPPRPLFAREPLPLPSPFGLPSFLLATVIPFQPILWHSLINPKPVTGHIQPHAHHISHNIPQFASPQMAVAPSFALVQDRAEANNFQPAGMLNFISE